MTMPISRRGALKGLAAGCIASTLTTVTPDVAEGRITPEGWIVGRLSGARACVEALLAEGVECVYGIPGAQENELWDAMKSRNLPYLLVTHEFSAACMADGYARSKGKPGVLSVVPGPGVTNSLTGLGEALLDSVPIVAIVGDVARGDKYRPFQVHELPNADLLRPVTKQVFCVKHVGEIPTVVRHAFRVAMCGEPGPVAVVIPYNLLLKATHYKCPPPAPLALPFDEEAFHRAVTLLCQQKGRVGIYAGQGCMNYSQQLAQVAQMLQAPVATSVSGKGVIDECHPLAVGWGYGPQGTRTAEWAFVGVDVVLAVGVRYSEVSTGFYSIPKHRHVIHVDANPNNLGRVVKSDVCVHADAGIFLDRLLQHSHQVGRAPQKALPARIRQCKHEEAKINSKSYARCGVDPMLFVQALRGATCPDAMIFVDVSLSEHYAAEAYTVHQPRTYFNPTDNQSMGWSIPASIGAQRVHPGRQTVTITGDGCFLMSAMEISTTAREGLPVKFFVLDDQAYHYMQKLQESAYKRTTATILANLDYAGLARGFGVSYFEINGPNDLEGGIHAALACPGPALVRVKSDYGKRSVRWIDAAKDRFIDELSAAQKTRFLARVSSRSLHFHPNND